MIIEGFVVCNDLSNREKIEYDLLKSINDTVFKEIVDWTRNPTSLRIDLSKFGVWYFKKSKTELKKDMFLRVLRAGTNKLNEENILKRLKNIDFILSEYKKYNEDKYLIKCLKYGKENYEAYCLAKKQEKIQKTKKDKLK